MKMGVYGWNSIIRLNTHKFIHSFEFKLLMSLWAKITPRPNKPKAQDGETTFTTIN